MPKQDQTKIISGKDLGALALEDFCPRCFWLERHNGKAPGIFPGIFSTIDSLSKKSVRRSFSERGILPDWLKIENVKSIIDFKKISMPIKDYGDWILTGNPDDVFELKDGSFHIVDYKTAKFTETQDKLLPMYEVQLNAYAYALPYQGLKPISQLTLIYCEPNPELDNDNSFKLTFISNNKEINLRLETIPILLKRAREILDNKNPPLPNPNCKGICLWVNTLSKKLNL